MKKKLFIIIVCVLMVICWAINVAVVNSKTEKVPEEIYSMGKWVEYGDNFYDKSTENKNGYSIKVVDAAVKEFDAFLQEKNISVVKDENMSKPQYIYAVTVVVKNENNTKSGLNMIDTTLNSVNNMMQVDFEVFDAMYPQLEGSISFSVRPGTEMEFCFPFAVVPEFEKICTYDYLTENSFYLNLSQYPIERSIEVHV